MIHRFGAFELNEHLFELRKGRELVPIQPKAFDILTCLLKGRGTVLSRADLGARVWPGVIVTSDSVAQAIMAARAAIGDGGESPTFIQTVRGRGYSFVAPVDSVAGQSAKLTTPVATRADPTLIGRGASLSTLLELLERARGGRGGVCLVTGESGIGKTRLVEELGADPTGVETIFARCYEGDGAPDLWPFARALQRLRAAGAIVEGDVAALADGRLPARTLADPKSRFALLDGIARTLTARAATRPLLLVVDDLHLADLPTLHLIALLSPQVRSAALLFVGVYSPTTPRVPSFRAAMGALSQEPSTATVRLAPLGRDEVGMFMKQAIGQNVSESMTAKALEKTGGNPHLLSELVHVLGTGARPDVSMMATSVLVGSEGMRDAITSMLAELPDSASRVLALAAVFGQSFRIAALAAALDMTNDVLLRELDAADVARVVARVDAASYRFMYPLVRDVIYKRLLGSERAALHRSAAIALERHLGDDPDHAGVAEIAHHLVEAAAAGDVDAAVDCSLRAAELARDAGDDAAAERYARRGLDAFRLAQSPDETKRARLGTFLVRS